MVIAKKSLGQNFLQSENIAKKIVEFADPKDKIVLEIGPGPGILTKYLIEQKPKKLILCEIDDFFYSQLKLDYGDLENIELIKGDFLKLNPFPIDVMIGNLPFNISTQILFKALEFKPKYCVFMFQKEVAEKIIAKPGSKNYGRISIIAQYYYDIKYLMTVPKRFFKPKPKVDAGVLKLIRKRERDQEFEKFIGNIFRYRNKNLQKVLKEIYNIDYKKDIKVKDLTVDEAIKIYSENIKKSALAGI